MAVHSAMLTAKQEKAIACLLVAPSVSQAARQAGIGERTLLRWLTLEVVQTAYRTARRQLVVQTIGRLQQASAQAVATLCEVMRDREAPASARVSAARTVLEMTLKGLELEDLAVRLTVVEAQMHATGPQQLKGKNDGNDDRAGRDPRRSA